MSRRSSQPWLGLAAAIVLLSGCDNVFDLERVPDRPVVDANTIDPNTVVQLSAGGGNTCVRLASGDVLCWGSGAGAASAAGDVQIPALVLRGAIDISVGDGGSCATLADHTALCWGANTAGELANGKLGEQRTPMPMLDPLSQPATDIASVAIGNGVACALRTNGHVSCAGSANWLGDGTTSARATLGFDVSFFDDAVALSAGDNHVCALRATNEIACWGDNNNGQLGINTPNLYRTPYTVPGTFVAVAAGDYHTCGLREDGSVVCWGDNQYGQMGNGMSGTTLEPPTGAAGISDAIALEASARSTHVLRRNGTVSGWGWNYYGQLGNNMTGDIAPVVDAVLYEEIRSISGRTSAHVCAQNATSTTVYCWGYNANSQLGNGTNVTSAVPVPVVGLP